MNIRYFNRSTDMYDIFQQDNDDRLYYAMDFLHHDAVTSDDTLSGTPTVTSEVRGGGTSDLVIEDVTASGLYAFMWISSGTPHKTYKIEVRATTNAGAEVEGDGYLRIGD